MTTKQPTRFALGQIRLTHGAIKALDQAEQTPVELLARHVTGDWGELDDEDKQENEFSVNRFLRIFSAYRLPPPPTTVFFFHREALSSDSAR